MFAKLLSAFCRQAPATPKTKPSRPTGLVLGYRLNATNSPITLSAEAVRTHLLLTGQPRLGARLFIEQLLSQQTATSGGWLFVDTKDDSSLAARLSEEAVRQGRRQSFQVYDLASLARLDAAQLFQRNEMALVRAPRLADNPAAVETLRTLLQRGCQSRLSGSINRDKSRPPFMCALENLPDYGDVLSTTLPSQARAAGVGLLMSLEQVLPFGQDPILDLMAGNAVTKVHFHVHGRDEAQAVGALSQLGPGEQDNLRMLQPERCLIKTEKNTYLARLRPAEDKQ